MADSQQAISLPSLILVAAIGAAALRYFFYSPTDPATRSNTSATRSVNAQHVEQVAAMFPQIPRRDIMWDLSRNGGNVAATTERVLTTGRLDTPPQTYQPVIPDARATSASSSRQKSNHTDLIEKYNLTERLKDTQSSSEDTASQPAQTWSTDKQERQSILQRRRDEMILNARRKMQEKDKSKSEGS